MKKVIVLSVQPQWVEKILKGEKTIEIRKTVPKDFHGDVYIYCTKAKKEGDYIFGKDIQIEKGVNAYMPNTLNGKIAAKFTLNKVEKINYSIIADYAGDELYVPYDEIEYRELRDKSCLDEYKLYDYANGKDLYAWHIDNLVIFDKPMELREFYKINKHNEDCFDVGCVNSRYCDEYGITHDICNGGQYIPITKAPQSFMFAWVEE